MSTSSNQQSSIILAGSANYALWFDYVQTETRKSGITKYIYKDILNGVNVNDPPNERMKEVKEDACVRSIIINSVKPNIHKEITGLQTSYDIIQKLNGKYGKSYDDAAYWMEQLHKLKATKETEILPVVEDIKDIFNGMEKANLKFSEDVKLGYLYQAIPQQYTKRFVLNKTDTFNSLYDKMKEDIERTAMVYHWNDSLTKDDPMDIDYAGNLKKNNNNYNNGNKYHNNYGNNKYNYKKHNHKKGKNKINKFCHI